MTQFAKEIAEDIHDFVDDNFILSYHMEWTEQLDMDIRVSKVLEALKIEMLHVLAEIFSNHKQILPEDFAFNDIIYTRTKIKDQV